MSDNPEDYELAHYGVKGMKWGKVKSAASAIANVDRKRVDLINRTNAAAYAGIQKGVKKAGSVAKNNKVYSVDNVLNRNAKVAKGAQIVGGILKTGAGKVIAADLKRVETVKKIDASIVKGVKTGAKKAGNAIKTNKVYSVDNVTNRFPKKKED